MSTNTFRQQNVSLFKNFPKENPILFLYNPSFIRIECKLSQWTMIVIALSCPRSTCVCVCGDSMFALNGGRNLLYGVYFTTAHSYTRPDFCPEIKHESSKKNFEDVIKCLLLTS